MKAHFNRLTEKGRSMTFVNSSLTISFIFSLLFCVVICLLFATLEITAGELPILFIRVLGVSWLFMITIKILFNSLLWMIKIISKIQRSIEGKKQLFFNTMPVLLICTVLLYACTGQPLAGVSKDLNTGMVTTYSKIKPESTVIVMNEEKLGHTQIPLGEKFIVINDMVEGLVVKNNKVSIGCSLLITDINGKELLNEADLFKNDAGLYDKKDAEYLKCTVSTGKPMAFDQQYKVAVKFWDKYGSGVIENKFTITIIDTP